MKNDVILRSKDRELFGITIRQNTKGGFLSVTDLQKAYKVAIDKYGWAEIRTHEFFSTKKGKLIVYELLFNENYITYDKSSFIEKCNDIGLIKLLKRLELWKVLGRGLNKETWCNHKIWKLIYINCFNDYSQLNCPKWIQEIDIYIQKYSIKRNESQEKHFLDSLIQKSSLFNKDITRQYRVENYIYDLKITILNIPFLIEYNEEQHINYSNNDNDKNKFNTARDNGYAYLSIPYNKESEQLDYFRYIFENKYTIDDINDVENFRFYSLLKTNTNYLKYTKLINIKVFGQHKSGIRNLASSIQLERITDIEKQIITAIENEWIRSEEDLVKFLKK